MTALGSAGIGLVWGWLVATLPAHAFPAGAFSVAAASAVFTAEAASFGGWSAGVVMLACAAGGLALRLGSYRVVRRSRGGARA